MNAKLGLLIPVLISCRKNCERMSAISLLNPKAEVARAAQSLAINISAAKGLQDVMKSNLGPKGTVKMWVLAHAILISSLTSF